MKKKLFSTSKWVFISVCSVLVSILSILILRELYLIHNNRVGFLTIHTLNSEDGKSSNHEFKDTSLIYVRNSDEIMFGRVRDLANPKDKNKVIYIKSQTDMDAAFEESLASFENFNEEYIGIIWDSTNAVGLLKLLGTLRKKTGKNIVPVFLSSGAVMQKNKKNVFLISMLSVTISLFVIFISTVQFRQHFYFVQSEVVDLHFADNAMLTEAKLSGLVVGLVKREGKEHIIFDDGMAFDFNNGNAIDQNLQQRANTAAFLALAQLTVPDFMGRVQIWVEKDIDWHTVVAIIEKLKKFGFVKFDLAFRRNGDF